MGEKTHLIHVSNAHSVKSEDADHVEATVNDLKSKKSWEPKKKKGGMNLLQ